MHLKVNKVATIIGIQFTTTPKTQDETWKFLKLIANLKQKWHEQVQKLLQKEFQ